MGTVLTTLQATDDDSAIAEYQLVEIDGKDNGYFSVEPLTGVVRQMVRIDYEEIKTITFRVIVTDNGVPQLNATAEIVVEIENINDHVPKFSARMYKMEVAENSPIGTVVGQVEAHDLDLDQYGEIEYQFIVEHRDVFHVDRRTGVITVANQTALDREQRDYHVLIVTATDINGFSDAVPVEIHLTDVNDNEPVFVQSHYVASVAENAAVTPPAAILQVAALDKDAGDFGAVRYYILDGNKNGFFMLDPDTGILYPARKLEVGDYVLRIEAKDNHGSGPHSDTADIKINVRSINHFPPVFIMPALTNATVELPYNVVDTDYLVMTVKATDDDYGLDGKVSYHLQVNNEVVQQTDEFIIDAASGELRTRTQLDRKAKNRYELVLYVKDQGEPIPFNALRFLTILLVDVNENRPEFPDASNPYKFYVTENGYKDTRIGKIQALVEDRGDQVYYYVLMGNEEGAFYVDKTSGDIFTNKSLDR